MHLYRVLVAEDNIVNQQVIIATLKKIGLEAQAVSNGAEVIAALQLGGFDLILMDCQMPEMDGFTATQKIMESEKQGPTRIPIIALTATARPEDKKMCLTSGMDDFLSKPFRIEQLVALLNQYLPAQRKSA